MQLSKSKKCEKDLIGSIEKYGQATKRLLVQSEKSGVKILYIFPLFTFTKIFLTVK